MWVLKLKVLKVVLTVCLQIYMSVHNVKLKIARYGSKSETLQTNVYYRQTHRQTHVLMQVHGYIDTTIYIGSVLCIDTCKQA